MEVQKEKKRYVITVEGIAPVIVQFETWAKDEDQALKQLDNPQLLSVRQRPDIDISRVRRRKVTIKDALTSLVKLIRNF